MNLWRESQKPSLSLSMRWQGFKVSTRENKKKTIFNFFFRFWTIKIFLESDDITHLLHKVTLHLHCNWTRSAGMELHPYNDDRENKHNIYLHWDIYNLSHTLELQCSEIWIQSHVDKGEEEERRERKELPFFFFFQLIYNVEDIGLLWTKRFPTSKNVLSWFIKD